MVADSSFLTPPVQRMFFQTGRAGGVSTSYGLGWETATAPFGLVIGHTLFTPFVRRARRR